MELFNTILLKTNDFLTGYVLLIVLVGGGIYLTVRTGFIQVREFRNGWHRIFGGLFKKKDGSADDSAGGLSSFQALCTAIAAQVGTGNLAGAATAIAAGGPGAIFWMWVSAFFGMATIFCEAVLAQVYRQVKPDGTVLGGPVYYIQQAFKGKLGKVLATIFAVLITLALGLFGNAVQANSITDAFHTAFFENSPTFTLMGQEIPWDKLIIGVMLAVAAWLIFAGGIKRIGTIAEKMVPLMAAFYLIGGMIILIMNIQNIPYMFVVIVKGAFNPKAVAGGVFGAGVKEAVKRGVARGLFSNEAGMGSTPNAHAQANVAHPVQQGQVAIVSVFIDTFMVLNMTAFVIISTKMIEPGSAGYSGGVIMTGISLTQAAFTSQFGAFGSAFVAICMFFFASSTILGWYFFGESNIRYLFGDKIIKPYVAVVCAFIVVGSLMKVETVWNMSDCFNSLMVIPNIIAVVALVGVVNKTYKDYRENFLPNHPEDESK